MTGERERRDDEPRDELYAALAILAVIVLAALGLLIAVA